MEKIQHRIGRIKEHLALVRSIKDDSQSLFVSDPLYRGALLHYLYLLADSCIVLAELVIKHGGLTSPQSYAEAFDILGDNGILDKTFAFDFAKIAGFRNFLAHDYEKVDGAFICGQILAKLDDIDLYLEQVQTSLGLKVWKGSGS